MNARRTTRLGTAAAVAALALSPLVGTTPAGAAAPTPTHGLDFDYFDEVYDDLGPDSVFETVTLERFKYLLRDKPGNFAFLIGDPNDANTQATIGHINDVAEDLGVDKIYNFTPKIDGGKWNLWNWNDLESVTGGNALTYWKNEGPTGNTGGNPGSYFSTHTDDYLNDDTTPEFVRTDGVIEGPYLFVYNKDRQIDVGGTLTDDHIVSSLSERKTEQDLDTAGEVNAFKEDVEDVLGAVPANQYATNSAFEFWKDEANRRHAATYDDTAEPGRYGGTEIITDADNADGWRVQPITYPEWVELLQQPGDIPFLFGGTWCHNTRAIVKDVNRLAQESGVRKVYQFDYSLFSSSNGSANYDHSRSSGTNITTGTGPDTRLLFPSHVYGQTINTYLTNAIAQYGKVGQVGTPPNTPHYYYPNGDPTQPVENAVRIQVGHFLTYNKDHEDAAGDPAPVVDQALRQNDDGGNTEHMTEWWFVKNRDLPASDGTGRGSAQVGSESLANQRAFAKEAISDIEQVFRGFTTSVASTTTVTGVDATVPRGTDVTLSVALDAPGYAPYVSSQGTGSGAPGTLVAKPRGWVRLLDDEDDEVSRARLTRAGTASLPIGVQGTIGARSYTVEYLGRGELIAPSSKEVAFEVIAANASTTTLAGPATTTFGAGGSLTATVTEGATGAVRLLGLPAPVEATISGRTATFALPATLPVGSYQVRVRYLGDEEYVSSESAPQTLTVGKAAATLAADAPATTYGSAATVKVTATGVAGATPAGSVTLTEGTTTVATGTLAGGAATLTLPASFAAGTHNLSVSYAGDGSFQAGTRAVTLTVAKGKAGAPTFKPKGTIRSTKAGSATVKVGTTAGLAAPDGKVRLVLTKGKTKKTVTVSLGKAGSVSAKLPKLAQGKWKVAATYLGNATYQAGAAKTFKLTVKK